MIIETSDRAAINQMYFQMVFGKILNGIVDILDSEEPIDFTVICFLFCL